MTKRGIRKLSPTEAALWHNWRASPRILKTVYTGKVEYRASAWATAAMTLTNKLDQNMDLRSILGAMKSTPIATMQKKPS